MKVLSTFWKYVTSSYGPLTSMAASNDPPSPGSQLLQTDNDYDDEWKQAENYDLPTLISSVEHGKYSILHYQHCTTNLSEPHLGPRDSVDRTAHAEADEAILDGIVSRGSSGQLSQQAPQQASIKVLTRPISSGKDPAAGFSFTKAKPIQQLDFRRPKQASAIHQPPDLPRPSDGIPAERYAPQPPSLSDTTQAVQIVLDVTNHQSPISEHHNAPVLKDSLPVPFSDATPAHSRDYKYPTPTTTDGPIKLNFSSTRSPLNEVSTAAVDALTDSNLNGTQEPGPLNIIIPNRYKPATDTFAPTHRPDQMMKAVDQPQVDTQTHSRNTSEARIASVAGTPKITKSRRRKTKMGPGTNKSPPPSSSKISYTEDDLLRLLMYRRKQGQQELEYFRATQQQKEAELQNLRDTSNQLSGQLQEVIQRETSKSAELSKIKASKPIWESKIKRLSDYVKGLTNDHNRLREDADVLQKQHQDAFIAREDLHNSLEDTQRSLEQDRLRFQQLKDADRLRIQALVLTVQNQSTQLQSEESLLMAERARTNRLEEQISRITASHGELLELFTGHRDTITGKIDSLLHHALTIAPPDKTLEMHSQDSMRPMIEQCVGMLQSLHEADTVKPDDLRKINDTVDSFVKGYVLPSV